MTPAPVSCVPAEARRRVSRGHPFGVPERTDRRRPETSGAEEAESRSRRVELEREKWPTWSYSQPNSFESLMASSLFRAPVFRIAAAR